MSQHTRSKVSIGSQKNSKSSLPTLGVQAKPGSLKNRHHLANMSAKFSNKISPKQIQKSQFKKSNFTSFQNGGSSFSDLVTDLTDVAEGVTGAMELNPISLLKLPNNILKTIDTGKQIVRNLTGQAIEKQQVVLDPHVEIKKDNETVIKELSKTIDRKSVV